MISGSIERMIAKAKRESETYSLYTGVDKQTASMLKSLDEYSKKVNSSKRSAREALIRIGVLDKNGELRKRYQPYPSDELKHFVASPPARKSYEGIDPDVVSLIKTVKAYTKKATSSKRAATQALISAGILDKNGKLRKRYRP